MTVLVSGAYRQITQAEAIEHQHSDAWLDPSIPAQQLALTDKELMHWTAGESIAPFDALLSCMRSIPFGSVLEVGCGVGHNADVIREAGKFEYTGVDYSEEFIRLAKNHRPARRFEVMDALLLDYKDQQFDTVISGCVLLHIVNWRRALSESARVARKFLVLHRTPTTHTETQYYFKKAYGVDCVEICFNEAELLQEASRCGFTLKAQYPVAGTHVTYLLERVNQ